MRVLKSKTTNLDLAVESLAGKFSHLFTVTTKAFLSKLYRIVQCNVPKIWSEFDSSVVGNISDIEEDLRFSEIFSDWIESVLSSLLESSAVYTNIEEEIG